jgi:hypothetical protein
MAIPLLIQRALAEIPTTEKPSACVNCDEFKKKDGYVTIFINANGAGHASLFIGKNTDKNRILYDPCGSYAKGKGYAVANPEHTWQSRPSGDIFGADDFSYRDYYIYHRADGPDINVYSFELTKDEQSKIYERAETLGEDSCSFDCARRISEVLRGIRPFKNLASSRWPVNLGDDLKKMTTMPTSKDKESVIDRMSGK